MIIANVLDDLLDFFAPVIDLFKDLWTDISNFFLQYMSQNVFNILVFGIVVAIILIIVLAVINRD